MGSLEAWKLKKEYIGIFMNIILNPFRNRRLVATNSF